MTVRPRRCPRRPIETTRMSVWWFGGGALMIFMGSWSRLVEVAEDHARGLSQATASRRGSSTPIAAASPQAHRAANPNWTR